MHNTVSYSDWLTILENIIMIGLELMLISHVILFKLGFVRLLESCDRIRI